MHPGNTTEVKTRSSLCSKMNLNFKPAECSDLDVLMQYMEDFHNFDHTEPFARTPARAAMERVVTDKAIGRVWLIQQEKEAIGFAVMTIGYRLEYRGYYAFLDELYIRPDKRRQGIGTAALTFLNTACQTLDICQLQLEVKNDNPGAIALYKKVGFQAQNRQILIARHKT